MDPQAWLNGVRAELVALAPRAEDSANDAWRAVVLMARLLAAPSQPSPAPELVVRLPKLFEIAGASDPASLLESLADALDGDEDPWGPLADACLDVDDAVSVGQLVGWPEAQELARQAAALIELSPRRVFSLEPLAVLRIATVRAESVVNVVWSAVRDAPALMLADALPQTAPTQAARAPGRTPAARDGFGIPDEALRAAAATEEARAWTIDTRGELTLCEEDGRLLLELAVHSDSTPVIELVARLRIGGEASVRVVVSMTRHGKRMYGDLGSAYGRDGAIREVLDLMGVSRDELTLALEVRDD